MRVCFYTRQEILDRQAVAQCGKDAALEHLAPWAAKFARVSDGYLAFESLADWSTWRRQR